MTVLQSIIDDVLVQLKAVATAMGYPNASVVYDEAGLITWPPAMAVDGVQIVLQLGDYEETRPLVTNCDRWKQNLLIGFSIQNSSATLGADVTKFHLQLVKQLRADRTRGGKADDTNEFSGSRWSYGDGTAAGGQIRCHVLYRNSYNDPDTPA